MYRLEELKDTKGVIIIGFQKLRIHVIYANLLKNSENM
jgi:hypothetical protein